MKSIAKILVQNGIVRVNFEEPFVWTSGIKSPIYCDCRELIGLPEARDEVVSAFIELIDEHNLPTDVVAGTATAGIPWASFVAQSLQVPMLYVRSKPKDHGAGKMVEGSVVAKEPQVLVIEDAVSTAGSSIKSAAALRSELSATVKTIMGIFTWSTPLSIQNSEEAELDLITLTNFDENAQALLDEEVINDNQFESLKSFHDAPADWWEGR